MGHRRPSREIRLITGTPRWGIRWGIGRSTRFARRIILHDATLIKHGNRATSIQVDGQCVIDSNRPIEAILSNLNGNFVELGELLCELENCGFLSLRDRCVRQCLEGRFQGNREICRFAS
jgi:hypothetical protein